MLQEPSVDDGRRSIASLEDYLGAVRKHTLLVAASGLALLALAIIFTSGRTAQFEATARVALDPTPVGSLDNRLVAPKLDREVEIVVSDAVLAAAYTRAGIPQTPGGVEATFQPLSDVLRIVVTDASATRSAALANAIAAVYVETRVQAQTDFYTEAEGKTSADMAVIQALADADLAQIRALDEEGQALLQQPASAIRDAQFSALNTSRGALYQTLDSDQALVRTMTANLTDTQRTRLTQEPAARVITEASVPDSPTGLNKKIFWIAGLLLGLGLGVVIAFLRQRLDRSASSTRDVELALGTKVVGSVPSFGWRLSRARKGVIMGTTHAGPTAERSREAYRRLRSSVLYLSRASNVKSVLITSNRSAEGKSTTAANLAMAASMSDTKTVLVSADLRRSSLETTLGVRNDRGLSEFLSGIDTQVYREQVPGFENLTIVPSGAIPSNPGELLNSSRFERLIKLLEMEFDLVIVDTAPVGATADAVGAARFTDGVLIVVDGKRTSTTDLSSVRSEFERTGVPILGAVMNRDVSMAAGVFGRRSSYGYGYYRKA